MPRRLFIVGLLAFSLLGAPALGASTLPVSPLPATWIRGANIVGYEHDSFSGSYKSQTDAALRQLKAEGGNTAVFVTDCIMHTFRGTSMNCKNPNSESDASLLAGIKYAKSLGLRIGVNPHVDTDDTYGRGQIRPRSWNTWWSGGSSTNLRAIDYDGEILHYAKLAQAVHASIFYVGTELDSASICPGTKTQISCATQWKTLIAKVRRVFTGKIAYAASVVFTNYPNNSSDYVPGYGLFPAWSKVDLIGVDSYFELDLPKGKGGTADPGVSGLDRAWHSFTNEYGAHLTYFGDLHRLATKYHKPVFASEVGFSDGEYSAHDPGSVCPDESSPCTDTVDLAAQTNAYESYFQTFAKQPWYAGMVLWDLQVDLTPSLTQIQVDPRGKPLYPLLKAWWTAKKG